MPKSRRLQASALPTLIVTGPSGSGKDTVVDELLTRYPNRLAKPVSATTRPPRPGEVQGKDYHFLKAEAFKRWQELGMFVETTESGGRHYGMLKREFKRITKAGQQAIVCCDTEGVENLTELDFDIKAVFLDVWIRQLSERICDRDRQIPELELNHRLMRAGEEKDWASARILHLPLKIVDNTGDLEATVQEVEEFFDLA